MRAGVNPASFHTSTAREPVDVIPIWPDMVDSFALFCDVPWQWVSLGMAGVVRTNISRLELEASARLLGITVTPEIFADIRTLESAAMDYWSRKR